MRYAVLGLTLMTLVIAGCGGGGSTIATAIEPVKTSDVVSPAYDANIAPPELLTSDLESGVVNFSWKAKAGADVYYVKVGAGGSRCGTVLAKLDHQRLRPNRFSP